jgi:hypothetical protein
MQLNPFEAFLQAAEQRAVAAIKKDLGVAYGLLPAFAAFLQKVQPFLAKVNWTQVWTDIEPALGPEAQVFQTAVTDLLAAYNLVKGGKYQ